MMIPKIRQTGVRSFTGVADPAYIHEELRGLHDIAQKAGYGTLEYLIACAMNEARWLADQQPPQGAEQRPPTGPSRT
jgi:hypothetical protein